MDIGKILGGVFGPQSAKAAQIFGQTTGSPHHDGGQSAPKTGHGAAPLIGALGGGALGGGLIAALLGSKKGRKAGGKILAYGGTALIAGLAYKAWRDHRDGKSPQSHVQDNDLGNIPTDSGFAPGPDPRHASANGIGTSVGTGMGNGHDFRLTLLRAMIAAAKADGHIDATEHTRIARQIAQYDFGPDEKSFLLDAFGEDADPVAIARLAHTSAQAAEIYLASSLAIDPDDAAEQLYLDRLAHSLSLDDALRDHLDFQALSARREFGHSPS